MNPSLPPASKMPKPSGRTKAREVWIFDSDRDFALRLAGALNQQAALACRCSVAARAGEAQLLLRRRSRPDLLILADGFPQDPPMKTALQGVPSIAKTKRLYPGFRGDSIRPGMRFEEMSGVVERALQKSAPGGISAKPLIFLTGFDAGLRRRWLRLFLSRQKHFGRPLYYFPFLPAYDISLPLSFGRGPELSSLLLLLASGARPAVNALGACFEAQKDGFYALRQGGRAEDLQESGPELQRSLLWLLHRFIRSREESSIALVEFSRTSFRRLRQLVGLADVLVCDMPKGSDYGALSARRELSALLAALPESVSFMELDTGARHFPGDPS